MTNSDKIREAKRLLNEVIEDLGGWDAIEEKQFGANTSVDFHSHCVEADYNLDQLIMEVDV